MTINYAARLQWITDFRSQSVEIPNYYPREPINFGNDIELVHDFFSMTDEELDKHIRGCRICQYTDSLFGE